MKPNSYLLTMASVLVLGLSATPALARHSGRNQGDHVQHQPGPAGGSTGTPRTGVVQRVTLSNPGGQPLHGIHITFSGKDSRDFSETDNCGKQLNGGASCTINVDFAPRTTGPKSATLDVSSSGGHAAVALSGTGV